MSFLLPIQGPPVSFKFFERNIWLNTSNIHKFNYKYIPPFFFPETLLQPIDLGIIPKNAKYMIHYNFIENNCVSRMVTPRY